VNVGDRVRTRHSHDRGTVVRLDENSHVLVRFDRDGRELDYLDWLLEPIPDDGKERDDEHPD
jgi:hypothetical protein